MDLGVSFIKLFHYSEITLSPHLGSAHFIKENRKYLLNKN